MRTGSIRICRRTLTTEQPANPLLALTILSRDHGLSLSTFTARLSPAPISASAFPCPASQPLPPQLHLYPTMHHRALTHAFSVLLLAFLSLCPTAIEAKQRATFNVHYPWASRVPNSPKRKALAKYDNFCGRSTSCYLTVTRCLT